MKAVVVALFAVLAVAAAVPAPVPAPARDDLKGSETMYMASPYMAAAAPVISTYAAMPAYHAYSYSVPAAYSYSASPYTYMYR